MSRPAPIPLLAALLALAGATLAAEGRAEPGARRTAARAEAAGVDPLARLSGRAAYTEVRAASGRFWRVGVFAEGAGLTVAGQATVWNVEGGAAFVLRRNLELTGSYRVVDGDLDFGNTDVDGRLSGPFLGMTLRF